MKTSRLCGPIKVRALHWTLALEKARLEHILTTSNLAGCEALPEVSWWLESWSQLLRNPSLNWLSLDPASRPIFDKIEEILAPHLQNAFPEKNTTLLAWEDRRDFANALIQDLTEVTSQTALL
jgi:hypothetical protein